MARRPNRFTIYDMMEQRGVFESNPANPDSRDQEGNSLYSGPVEFPKMLYHPAGATRITVQAEAVMTPMGPRMVGEQRELVYQIVNNPVEEEELLAAGWHKDPRKAVAIGAGAPLPEDPNETIARLEAEIRKMQVERDAATAAALDAAKPVGTTKSKGLLND